jgi:hypothetical protein
MPSPASVLGNAYRIAASPRCGGVRRGGLTVPFRAAAGGGIFYVFEFQRRSSAAGALRPARLYERLIRKVCII